MSEGYCWRLLTEMNFLKRRAFGAALILTAFALAQSSQPTQNPFSPLNSTADVILVRYTEFATLPDIPGLTGAPRPMLLLDEPATRRMFVNDMRGPLYSLTYDGKLTQYAGAQLALTPQLAAAESALCTRQPASVSQDCAMCAKQQRQEAGTVHLVLY
jgi:hypothetical protein